MLIADARSNKSNTGHALHNCELGTKYIGKTSNKLAALHFTNGVVKIQNDDIESMTVFENNACMGLLLSDVVEETSTSTNAVPLTCQERRELFKRPRRGK